jgi:hypothetical protein
MNSFITANCSFATLNHFHKYRIVSNRIEAVDHAARRVSCINSDDVTNLLPCDLAVADECARPARHSCAKLHPRPLYVENTETSERALTTVHLLATPTLSVTRAGLWQELVDQHTMALRGEVEEVRVQRRHRKTDKCVDIKVHGANAVQPQVLYTL